MKHRCPKSPFDGVARLDGWKFIVNNRKGGGVGYANIVRSESDHVWGLVFNLTADDEKELDKREGSSYEKKKPSKLPCGTKVAKGIRFAVWYMSIEQPQ